MFQRFVYEIALWNIHDVCKRFVNGLRCLQLTCYHVVFVNTSWMVHDVCERFVKGSWCLWTVCERFSMFAIDVWAFRVRERRVNGSWCLWTLREQFAMSAINVWAFRVREGCVNASRCLWRVRRVRKRGWSWTMFRSHLAACQMREPQVGWGVVQSVRLPAVAEDVLNLTESCMARRIV